MGKKNKIKPLKISQLYQSCKFESLPFETTNDLESLKNPLGQNRALRAIGFGAGIQRGNYNLFVMGSPGIGKLHLVRETLNRINKHSEKKSSDWCYVANFDTPHKPFAICLSPGRGRIFRDQMLELIQNLIETITVTLHGEEYHRRLQEIEDRLMIKEEKATQKIKSRARKNNVAVVHTSNGFSLVPMKGDQTLPEEEIQKLPEEEKIKFEDLIESLHAELTDSLQQLPLWQRDANREVHSLEQDLVKGILDTLITEIAAKYTDSPDVLSHLERVRLDVLENIDLFRSTDEDDLPLTSEHHSYNRYKVNLLLDNRDGPSVPVVYEANPTYQNLLGRVEHISHQGALITDFTMIKDGAMHRANDGYLLLDAEKLLLNTSSWDALKRVLKTREIKIQSLEHQLSLATTISLEPEPIPVNLKVVLIGDRHTYQMLKAYDDDFSQLFKVVVDFSEDMPRSPANDARYARLIASLQKEEGLLPITRNGVELIVEQNSRIIGDGQKLSLHIGELLDLMKESDFWAQQDKSDLIHLRHVQQALNEQEFRGSQIREEIQEQILDGRLMIDTDGIQLGRINGLSVYQLGDVSFGVPSRISATVRIGGGEVLDIQREVDLGGPIHSKGVFTLSAYLNHRYARYQPLSVNATLLFEQTYGEVEGDSASAGELCALLSALGDIPLTQSLAITGSINQHGEMQPIGGTCEKIEGFFDICKTRGLTGDQGVVIPQANVRDLMLKKEVVDAAKKGKFHIYAVDHVEQAMTLMCGMKAGTADKDGIFPEDSFNGRIQQRLIEWFNLRLQLAESGKGES